MKIMDGIDESLPVQQTLPLGWGRPHGAHCEKASSRSLEKTEVWVHVSQGNGLVSLNSTPSVNIRIIEAYSEHTPKKALEGMQFSSLAEANQDGTRMKGHLGTSCIDFHAVSKARRECYRNRHKHFPQCVSRGASYNPELI